MTATRPTTPSLTEPDADAAVTAFTDRFGRAPERVWLAPGRVNLIGEHTDYNDGFVLPLAIPAGCLAAAAPNDLRLLRIHSVQHGDAADVDLDTLEPGAVSGWEAYVAGVAWALVEGGGEVGGVDLLVDGNVPGGSGLSSSAAIVSSVAGVLADVFGLDAGPDDLVAAGRRAENDVVGAPTGGMDQLVSVRGEAGKVLLCDMRDLSVEPVRFDLGGAGLTLLVVDSRAPHQLVTSEYGERRRSCERAAQILGVAALRDVSVEGLPAALDRLRAEGGEDAETLVTRTRHVVTEDERVLRTAEYLRAGDFRAIGAAMAESHASMRDDFAITVPEVDLVVSTVTDLPGVVGSRMTGGGFGGCVITVLDTDRVEEVVAAVVDAFADAGFDRPEPFTTVAAAGARRVR